MSDIILDPNKLSGWAGPDAAKAAWQEIGHMFEQFAITGAGQDETVGKRFALYEIVRKVLGHDTRNYAQETGDCFVAGTLVTLGDGGACPIEDVGCGEEALSGGLVIREVDSAIHKTYTGNLFKITALGRNAAPPCTADHQFQRPNGDWVAASQLHVGDYIAVVQDASNSEITSVKITDISTIAVKDEPVYCFSVPEDHSFILYDDGYIVHNCVSFGAKNAVEYIQAIEMSLGQSGEFREIFPPYLYNIGRVLIGNGQMKGKQGSVGSWQAKGVEIYGCIPDDMPDCPKYSGDLANTWGDVKLDDKFYTAGKIQLVRTTSPINSWDDLRRAVGNGYACTIASNQGFEMMARSDGFHYQSGTWGHQMCIVIVDDDPKNPYVGILNSWGDVHGVVVDFKTGEKWPVGMMRVRRSVVEHMIQSGECIAYSSLVGYPSRKLNWASII